MGKIISLTIGSLAIILGIILLIRWSYEFFFMLKGSVPLVLIFAGVIALSAGLSELKDIKKSKET